MDEQVKGHIKTFASVMDGLGYDGPFNMPEGIEGPLDACLKKYALACEMKGSGIEPFIAGTLAYQSGDGKYVSCGFGVRYDREHGFSVFYAWAKRDDNDGNDLGMTEIKLDGGIPDRRSLLKAMGIEGLGLKPRR